MGALLASLPLDVGVGKMLVLATFTGLLEEALVLAALLSVQSPFKCEQRGHCSSRVGRSAVDN